MPSWDETTIEAAAAERLLDAIFAAVALSQAELRAASSAPQLYRRLCERLGLAAREGSHNQFSRQQPDKPCQRSAAI